MGTRADQSEEGRRRLAILARARQVARVVLREHGGDARTDICLALLEGREIGPVLSSFRDTLRALPVDERHYWIGTFYTLLLPERVRRRQATYFTPPPVAVTILDLVVEAGFDLTNDNVLDPAAGGAAFLSTLAGRMAGAGIDPSAISYRLNGIEIDEGLATLSRHLISERLGAPLPRKVIVQGDALRTRTLVPYDLVIANPPYGRLSMDDVPNRRWQRIAHSGHINKYAVFAELCFRSAKPGGLVVLVIPSSFRAGPLYDRMRRFIRSQGEVLALGSISGRDSVFIDVTQDVSVLVARKGEPHRPDRLVRFPVIKGDISAREPRRQALPADEGGAWPTPPAEQEMSGGATLADYGVSLRTGYFVWNREKHRMRSAPEKDGMTFPLIWAKNVKAGEPCIPAGKRNDGIDFVAFRGDSNSIVRGPAAVMQRTTNDKQPRRLVAAKVPPAVIEEWGGFVTENHTIVLTANDPRMLSLAVKLLNTRAVDLRYRRVSGTAAVSVILLREIDLPRPNVFEAALDNCCGDAEAAAEAAYQASAEKVTV